MKTFIQWIDTLDQVIRGKALKNAMDYNSSSRLSPKKYPSLFTALSASFVWYKTAEGHDYWLNIAKTSEHENKKTMD